MIADLIFGWAKRTPDKTAVIIDGRSLSYRALAYQIAVARGYFAQSGYAGPGYAVLATTNPLEFWILSLALRSLGLTTVAIRNTEMLSELELQGIRCVVVGHGETWADLSSLCKARGLTLISVSLADAPPADHPPSELDQEFAPHILLTSGTTGRHKMLLSTPAIDAVSLRQKIDVTGMNQDTVLSVFNFGAWTGVGYKWAASPWMVGGTTLIEMREPHLALLHPRITHGITIPSVLNMILAAPANAYARNDSLQLIVGAAAMTRRQIEQAKARITSQLVSMMGSTEGGSIAYTPQETAEDARWHRLMPRRVIEVVSETGQPVPAGEVGWLRVSTKDGPAGYFGDEAATKHHFRDGYFYPGDLVIKRADGRIALQGRSTDVINVQGAKIYPGPIEDRLCEVLRVSGVCLFSKQNEDGEEELYVAIEAAKPIEAERLRDALQGELLAFPIAHIRYLKSMPRNPMGKVQRQTVRAEVTAGPQRPI